MLALIVSVNIFMTAKAEGIDKIAINGYSQDVNLVIQTMNLGDVVENRILLNQNGEANAYYLEFSNGYIIYGLNGIAIEYSDTMKPAFSETNDDVYYLGPFLYYYLEDGLYVNFMNGSSITSTEFEESCNKFLEISTCSNEFSTSSVMSTNSTPVININKLDDPIRCYAWNDENECGSLAALHILLYYSDIKNQMLTTSYFDNHPEKLYDSLLSYIQTDGINCPHYDPSTDGSTLASLRDGLNDFLSTQPTSLRLRDDINMSVWNMAVMTIGSAKVPVILGHITGPNTGHMVLSYGYRHIKVDGKTVRRDFIVNDGYGHNGRYVNESYALHLFYLSK